MWTRAEYESAANEIGRQFAESGGSMRINDLATKIATDNHLNPEGIQTLVRLANVSAFQELFSKRAGADDRMIEFEVGDPDLVVSNMYNGVKQAAVFEQKTNSVKASSYDRAMDWYSPLTKVAEDETPADLPGEEDKSEEPETNAEEVILGKKVEDPAITPEAPIVDKQAMARFNIKRAQETIDEETRRLAHEWGLSLEKAAQTLRVSHGTPKFDIEKYAFFEDVVCELGPSIIPEVRALNVMVGGDYVDSKLHSEKLASLHERRVSSLVKTEATTQILDFVKEASRARQKREEYASALAWLNTKMTELTE